MRFEKKKQKSSNEKTAGKKTRGCPQGRSRDAGQITVPTGAAKQKVGNKGGSTSLKKETIEATFCSFFYTE